MKELSTCCTVSVDEIGIYMQEQKSEFSDRFQDFQRFGPMLSFLIKPENFNESDLDLSEFQWMGVEDFEVSEG